MEQHKVIVVGGGWAGLAAAVELARQGYQPVVIEAAKQLGGRARKVPFNGMAVDNGQHLFLGAYQNTLQLLDLLKVDVKQAFTRQALHLHIQDLHAAPLTLKAPNLPAPLHLMWGLLTADGLSSRSRLKALRFGLRLLFNLRLKQDTDVLSLLRRAKQPAELIGKFWEPLCIAILNTPIEQSSATLFLNVLHDAFMRHRRDSDLLYARQDLGSLFTEPAMTYVEQQGGHVLLGQRVMRLLIKDGVAGGVITSQNKYYAKHVILALPPYAGASLLASEPGLAELTDRLNAFRYEPICTIYLQYQADVQLPQPMIGLRGGLGQWVFDRRIYQQPGLMAVVISSQGRHLAMDNTDLVEQVSSELAQHYPDWPAPLDGFVIREKRATFASHVDINRIRPEHATPVTGLWLAGDYTNTGYPATLEGAIRSGLQCAGQLQTSVNS